MAMTKQNYKNDCIIFNTLNDLVPQEHLVRKLDDCINFTFIEELVKDLYSDFGRPSIPPVVLFKLIFINISIPSTTYTYSNRYLKSKTD